MQRHGEYARREPTPGNETSRVRPGENKDFEEPRKLKLSELAALYT